MKWKRARGIPYKFDKKSGNKGSNSNNFDGNGDENYDDDEEEDEDFDDEDDEEFEGEDDENEQITANSRNENSHQIDANVDKFKLEFNKQNFKISS